MESNILPGGAGHPIFFITGTFKDCLCHDRPLWPGRNLSSRVGHRPVRLPLRVLHVGRHDLSAQGRHPVAGYGTDVSVPSTEQCFLDKYLLKMIFKAIQPDFGGNLNFKGNLEQNH